MGLTRTLYARYEFFRSRPGHLSPPRPDRSSASHPVYRLIPNWLPSTCRTSRVGSHSKCVFKIMEKKYFLATGRPRDSKKYGFEKRRKKSLALAFLSRFRFTATLAVRRTRLHHNNVLISKLNIDSPESTSLADDEIKCAM